MDKKVSISKRFNLLQGMSGMKDWIHATYVLFLAEKGLSQLEINSINTFFMAGNFIFEPISGYVQDKIGQIQIYWLGTFFWAVSFFTYYFGETYWHFVGSELIGALGMAALVGSLEAFLENKLGPLEAKKVRADGRSIRRFVEMVPVSLGAFAAARWGLGFPWILSSVANLIVLVASVFILKPLIKIPDAEETLEMQNSVKLAPREVVKFVLGNPKLLTVAVVSFVAKFVFQAYNMTWTRIFAQSIPKQYVGLIWVGVSLVILLGLRIARKVDHSMVVVLISLVIVAVSMLYGSLSTSVWILLVMFYIHELFRSLFHEALETYASTLIPNKIRSSAKSVLQTITMLGAVLGLPVSGWLGDKIGLLETWTVVSGFLLLFSAVGLILLLVRDFRSQK